MMLVTDTWLNVEHIEIFLAGSTALGLIAHAVNTFPTPSNKYGQWFLGLIKFAVGQRQSAMNAMRGQDTVVVPVPQGTGAGLTKSNQDASHKVEVTHDAIKVSDRKTTETETIVPNPTPPKEGG
jgi:hypothetical protein